MALIIAQHLEVQPSGMNWYAHNTLQTNVSTRFVIGNISVIHLKAVSMISTPVWYKFGFVV